MIVPPIQVKRDISPPLCLHVSGSCLALVILASLWLSGCTSLKTIATFAETAQKALNQGPAIFRDIHESCIRRHEDAQAIAPIYLPAPTRPQSAASTNTPAVCVQFAAEGDALAKASDVLVAYFKAIQQLASFNTSTVSTPSLQTAENAALSAQLSYTQMDSVGKLAGFVTQAFTERYQRKRLISLLREADPSISSLTKGFEDIASKNYEGLLREERQTITARYQKVGYSTDGAVTLLLDRAYTQDLNDMNRRSAVAQAYIQALGEIRDGHHKLAEIANHLRAKDLNLALDPYIGKLQTLLPALQSGS